jgi:hypothetical protein
MLRPYYVKIIPSYQSPSTMSKTINISGLRPEQIEQIQAIIEAFQAKNQLDNLASSPVNTKTQDIIDILTENPIEVNGFITREEIYERQ